MGKDKVGNEVEWGETRRGNERLMRRLKPVGKR